MRPAICTRESRPSRRSPSEWRRPGSGSCWVAASGRTRGRTSPGRSSRRRATCSTVGPSAELALAHMRLAGLDAFELDYAGCLTEARTAVEIAGQAGAEFERVWALGFVGLGLFDAGDVGQGFDVMDQAYREAQEREFWQIAGNIAWNDIWMRTHTMN